MVNRGVDEVNFEHVIFIIVEKLNLKVQICVVINVGSRLIFMVPNGSNMGVNVVLIVNVRVNVMVDNIKNCMIGGIVIN